LSLPSEKKPFTLKLANSPTLRVTARGLTSTRTSCGVGVGVGVRVAVCAATSAALAPSVPRTSVSATASRLENRRGGEWGDWRMQGNGVRRGSFRGPTRAKGLPRTPSQREDNATQFPPWRES
jgi:hypothetical protein